MDEILDILFKEFFETHVINKKRKIDLTDNEENRIVLTFPDDSADTEREKREDFHSKEN
jgi:hypothetical protein